MIECVSDQPCLVCAEAATVPLWKFLAYAGESGEHGYVFSELARCSTGVGIGWAVIASGRRIISFFSVFVIW